MQQRKTAGTFGGQLILTFVRPLFQSTPSLFLGGHCNWGLQPHLLRDWKVICFLASCYLPTRCPTLSVISVKWGVAKTRWTPRNQLILSIDAPQLLCPS